MRDMCSWLSTSTYLPTIYLSIYCIGYPKKTYTPVLGYKHWFDAGIYWPINRRPEESIIHQMTIRSDDWALTLASVLLYEVDTREINTDLFWIPDWMFGLILFNVHWLLKFTVSQVRSVHIYRLYISYMLFVSPKMMLSQHNSNLVDLFESWGCGSALIIDVCFQIRLHEANTIIDLWIIDLQQFLLRSFFNTNQYIDGSCWFPGLHSFWTSLEYKMVAIVLDFLSIEK